MPGKLIDLSGMTFGRLYVIERTTAPNPTKHHRTYWRCRCKCGKEHVAIGQDLRELRTKSCGCLRSDRMREMGKKMSAAGSAYQRTEAAIAEIFDKPPREIDRAPKEWNGAEGAAADLAAALGLG